MRDAFQGAVAQLGTDLAAMSAAGAAAMRHATRALLEADLPLAEQVLADDATIDAQRTQCEEHAHSLLALQAPVASDLRAVLAAVYCAEKIERMGDLAAHLADTARVAHPSHAVPVDLRDTVAELGRLTASMADRLTTSITAPEPGVFTQLADIDRTVDDLHAGVLTQITDPDFPHGPRAAATLALVTRFYERFADQVVSVARRLDFVTTGELPT
ncbi:phosphate transport system regulatory protein PhoU [Actinosynnema sp. ALI-1.44]|uniref:phosphate signaling complex PhoU family protein n=1 Tax=Actinosynnema sp. ALI-1.44 TaxID=1933779 RepID=UPI00097C55FC|nr:phosphate uptake regulator PhoU [Actinosynnema sp. ALI-1.44]ONI78122.1 phosphate transport system regulatory protein PhoU [Actinosynnema sp. ALI-1.44]